MALFLLLAFGLAWVCQLPVYSGIVPDGALSLALLALGGIAPTLAAILVTRGAAWRETWHGPRPVWALALGLLGPTLLLTFAGLSSGSASFSAPNLPAVLLPPLGEELGWRGTLLPNLRMRMGSARANLTVSMVWALWHLPSAWTDLAAFPSYALSIVTSGVLVGFLWERSGRSTLVAVACHAGINLGVAHAGTFTATLVWVSCAIIALLTQAVREVRPARST